MFLKNALFALSATLAACALPAERRATTANLQSWLFPSSQTYSAGFSTAKGISVKGVSSVALSDSALNVIKVSSITTHQVVEHEGKTAWKAIYPKGSWSPSHKPKGGFGFYVNGTDAFQRAITKGAKQVQVGYSVMFQDGFEWQKGGKLPGGFGGVGKLAYGCSGGRQENRDKCFGLRLMWRSGGAGELYTYMPLTSNNAAAASKVPPKTIENPVDGFSVGRGAFYFKPGEWYTITEQIFLNDVGKNNGKVHVLVNGKAEIELNGVSLRESKDSVVMGMQFDTFFGGSTSSWASPITQSTYFADVSGAVFE